ncbi:MAG: pyruvate, water dikinase, partial [Proteobacteria bacterium]|nr:pyruvate, water dikinase [Pseudomonadota bacterium]
VLAVEQPLPRWAPLLGRAAALVGVKGGAAGHLASVAREFGVPALLGVGPGGRDLAPGQEVTVDAGGRAVYAGRLPLPGRSAMDKGVPDTPVRRALSQVLAHAAPLNLLDPEDAGFTPEACRTLHDLTRFCHQKAVEEMFSLAAQEHFPLNAARQLYYHAPMQWWVIDLDDGVRRPLSGKYVRPEDILCAPFHAFWEGLLEIPWQGPPPLDAKGMASVMFQTTANPALATGVKSSLAERNYFLITKEFLNLQSRVGFHFSSLEAMVTPLAADNLVSFCFRGGAADPARRRARLAFLEEFLAGLGMVVSIKGDALLARAEELPAPECLAMVKALGYLIMHTRQLDMIMASPQRVEHYRAKIAADLAALGPPAGA